MATMFSSFIKKPRHTHFAGEDPGEEVLYVLRRSFVTNMGWITIGFLMIVTPILVNFIMLAVGVDYVTFLTAGFVFVINSFWYLITFGFLLERFLNWYFNVYIITNKRIVDMDFYHFLYRRVSDAPLRNIEDISYDVQGFVEALFNYGDVIIQTAAERPQFEFHSVANPARVQDILSDLVKEVKHHG